MEQTLRDLPVSQLELDECWTWCVRKQGHLSPEEARNDSIGDRYVYIGLDRATKLVVAWRLGKRDRENT